MPSKNDINTESRQNQKHFINTKLVDLIEYRQARKWYVSISVVGMFAAILILMIYFMAQGKDVLPIWMERNLTINVRWICWFICKGY